MGHISCLFNCRVEWGLHIELGNTLVLLHILYPAPPPDRSNGSGSPLVWPFIIWCGFCFHIRQQHRSRVTINVANSLSHVKWHLGNKMCTWNVYTTSTHTHSDWHIVTLPVGTCLTALSCKLVHSLLTFSHTCWLLGMSTCMCGNIQHPQTIQLQIKKKKKRNP